MSLNKFIPKSSKSFSFNLKRLSEGNNKIKIKYLDKSNNYCSKNTNLNNANSFINKKQPKYRNFAILLNKNHKYKSYIYPKFNSIIKDKNIVNIQSDSNSLSLYKTKSNSYFDYKKKLVNKDKNSIGNYFKNDSMIKNYNTNINIEKFKNRIKNEIGNSFSPKNRIKAMKIYEILEFSDFHNTSNTNNLSYLKKKNIKNHFKKLINKKPVKYNNFFNSNLYNKNINILEYNSTKKKEIKPIDSLLEINNLKIQDKNNNYLENNTNKNNDRNIFNKKNKKLIKSFSQCYYPNTNIIKNNVEDLGNNINNNEKGIVKINQEDFIITNGNEHNNSTVKTQINNLSNNEIQQGKMNETNNKTANPYISNYLNKYRGDQKRIMEECIRKLNYNYSDDNFNYNYQVNYNDFSSFGTSNTINKLKETINPQINNETNVKHNNNSLNCQIINNNYLNDSNYFKVKDEENKENSNINTDENSNEEKNIIKNEKPKNNYINQKKYKDIFSKAQLINFKKQNKKNIEINLNYPDENIDFNKFFNKDNNNYLSQDNNNTKSYFNNRKNNLTTKFKNTKNNSKNLLNNIPRHEYKKDNKNKYSNNIQKFVNQKKNNNVTNLHKKLSKTKFNFMNKKISVMPPNDYDREIITNVIKDLYYL